MRHSIKGMLQASTIVAVLCSGHAVAHGVPDAKHGGHVTVSSDVSYELTRTDGKVTIYLEDHGRAVNTAAYSGKLTVLKGTDKTEAALTPVAPNGLEASVATSSGDKLVATLKKADGKTTSVRFVVK